ncbi:MAG: NUDIX domain-containing protein [Planctomycetota bacterium]
MSQRADLNAAPAVPAGALHVTAALVLRGRRTLIARRVRPDALRGLWEFPGGKVEPGEAPEAALARELQEELGLAVTVHGFVARSTDAARPLVLDAYHCTYDCAVPGQSTDALHGTAAERPFDDAPRPNPIDGTHDAARWVEPDELAALAAEGALAPLDVPLARAWLARAYPVGPRRVPAAPPMLDFQASLARLAALDVPRRVERVALERALGRVLAEAVVMDRNQPAFDRSTMDGYAVVLDGARDLPRPRRGRRRQRLRRRARPGRRGAHHDRRARARWRDGRADRADVGWRRPRPR